MDVKQAIQMRRAYRSLEPAEITGELIRDLAESARLAPSCNNNQPWRFVFVYDPEVLRELHGALSRGNCWIQAASMIIAVFSREDLDCRIKGRDYYLFDTGMATAFLMLRATELGLVAHPVAGYDEEAVKEILGIPDDMRVITLVNVGKHSETIGPLLSESQVERETARPERLPLGEFAYVNAFPDGRLVDWYIGYQSTSLPIHQLANLNKEGPEMSQNMLDLIRKRRTIRKFTDEDVSEEQVETLLEMAMCAPNRLNRQPWHFVVIRDKGLQKQVADILRVHHYLEKAPVVIAVCALPQASPTWIMDISAATENMLLAATSMGLGAAWVGAPDTVLWDLLEEALCDALAIPFDVRIPTLVAVGHPAQELSPHGKHDRFDRTKVHYGRWGELKLSEEAEK